MITVPKAHQFFSSVKGVFWKQPPWSFSFTFVSVANFPGPGERSRRGRTSGGYSDASVAFPGRAEGARLSLWKGFPGSEVGDTAPPSDRRAGSARRPFQSAIRAPLAARPARWAPRRVTPARTAALRRPAGCQHPRVRAASERAGGGRAGGVDCACASALLPWPRIAPSQAGRHPLFFHLGTLSKNRALALL